jgi:hypothetical protein
MDSCGCYIPQNNFFGRRRRSFGGSHLFLFIGANPNTDWLEGSDIALDANGFVVTGSEAGAGRHVLETTRRGVFAIGDVRAKSVKRVAAAVGESAQVVAALHSYLASAESDLVGHPVLLDRVPAEQKRMGNAECSSISRPPRRSALRYPHRICCAPTR